MKKVFSTVSLILCVLLLTSMFSACSGSEKNPKTEESAATQKAAESSEAKKEEPLLEYSIMTVFDETPKPGFNNPNDVVTPVVEKMFNIKLKDIVLNGGMGSVERINMLVAANNVPDVVFVDNPNVPTYWATGAFADLTPYKDLMVNTDKLISDAGWNMLTIDKKLVALTLNLGGGEIDLSNPEIADTVKNDISYQSPGNWALVVNQDILKQAGYTFKTIKDVQSELDAAPRKITDEDVKIVPELNTVEDLEKLLYKIKELNLKVDGKPVIPLSLNDWAAYHLSILYAPHGAWYCDPATMQVSGFLFNPGMKEFYKTWKKWYNDGVLDKDYLIHKPEQYTEKAASGRVAVMFPGFDPNTVRNSLKEKNPENDLRVIPWPKSSDDHFIDPSYPCGFGNIMINKNFKDIPRLLKYFDWVQSEEGMDLLTWGPESSGLWEIKDGKKVLKDIKIWEALRDGTKPADGKDAEFYGLNGTSKAALGLPGILYNTKGIDKSYPVKLDAYNRMFIHVSTKKLNRDGRVRPGAGEKTGLVNSYYWSTVKTAKIAELISTKTDADFDKTWDLILKDLKEQASYDDAVAEMIPVFKQSLGK